MRACPKMGISYPASVVLFKIDYLAGKLLRSLKI